MSAAKTRKTILQQLSKFKKPQPTIQIESEKIIFGELKKEDYGQKYPYYPVLWTIDKKLGIDYEYSAFEEALVPYQDKPAEQDGPYDQIFTTIKTRLSDNGKYS